MVGKQNSMIGVGMSIGLAVGMAIGIARDELALGISFGLLGGVVGGVLLSNLGADGSEGDETESDSETDPGESDR